MAASKFSLQQVFVVVAPIHLVPSSGDISLGRWRGHWGMNSTVATYTPLECLLLFQTLVAYGTEEQDFDRISSLLTNNDLIKDAETYDAQRLSSEALRQLYLQLLRDEIRAEDEAQDDPTSKKRKLPTPPLPSIKDAQEYKEKLPSLVDRLYARYREIMVKAIREDERRYAAIQEEIQEIERGEWDNRILEQDKVSNGIATETPKTNGSQENLSEEPRLESVKLPSKPSSPLPSPRPEASPINNPQNKAATPASPRIPEPARAQGFPPPSHPRTGSIGPHGPSPLQGFQPDQRQQFQPGYGQGHAPTHQGQAAILSGQPPAGYMQWETLSQSNFQAPPNPQYNQYPPQSQPLPQNHQPRPFSSPHGVPPPQPHVPSSPVNQNPSQIVPPPQNSIHRPPSSPAMPLDALADAAGQHRAHSGSPLMSQASHGSPMMQQVPSHGAAVMQYPASHGSPMIQHNPQMYPGTPIMQGPPPGGQYTPHQRSPSANGPVPFNQQYLPFQGPQQFQSQSNHRTPFQQPNIIQQQPKTYNSPYNAGLERKPSILPQTPFSRGLPRHSTGSGTVWTPNPSGSTPKSLLPFDPPKMEPLSPVLLAAKPPEKTSPKKKTPRGPESTVALQSVEQPKKQSKSKITRGSYRGREGSTASSVIAGSHRSQSVMSHADELSLNNENINRNVKQEVATPVGIDDGGETTADELPRHPRAGPSPTKSTKRKRVSSIPFEPIETKPSKPPSMVLWTKAFPKISSSALESIAGHKNASTFSFPVKERDAPGYKTLILRPQDLKSIRSAIMAGSRAATAAAAEDPNYNANPTASSLWLPISEDLIPPKGIINYAQLEKELMRMFANAIMFNADPDRGLGRRFHENGKDKGDVIGYEFDVDGIVKDTKAMFTDVEKVVGSLRSAERRSEEMREDSTVRQPAEDDDADELAGDGDSHVGNTGTVKRRRK